MTTGFWNNIEPHMPANLRNETGIFRSDEAPMGLIVACYTDNRHDKYVVDMMMDFPRAQHWFVKVPDPQGHKGWRWQHIRPGADRGA